MLRGLFGTKFVSVGELEVGDRIRLDTFKNAGQTYNLDVTITAIVPSEQLEDFYWIHSDGAPAELFPAGRLVQLLRKGKK